MTAEPQPNNDSRLLWFFRGGLFLFGGIGLMALWPSSQGFWTLDMGMSDRTLVLEEASPDSTYRLLIESTSPWSYGPHSIRIDQAAQGRRQNILRTRLYNDGANLLDDNVRLTWQGNRQALLKLEGQEQAPACHLLVLGQSPRAQDMLCPGAEDEAGEKPELIPDSPIALEP